MGLQLCSETSFIPPLARYYRSEKWLKLKESKNKTSILPYHSDVKPDRENWMLSSRRNKLFFFLHLMRWFSKCFATCIPFFPSAWKECAKYVTWLGFNRNLGSRVREGLERLVTPILACAFSQLNFSDSLSPPNKSLNKASFAPATIGGVGRV